jgi:hypothetical protein
MKRFLFIAAISLFFAGVATPEQLELDDSGRPMVCHPDQLIDGWLHLGYYSYQMGKWL